MFPGAALKQVETFNQPRAAVNASMMCRVYVRVQTVSSEILSVHEECVPVF